MNIFNNYWGCIMLIKLNQEQINELFKTNQGSGGFQSLMSKLQNNFNERNNTLKVDKDLLKKILKYTFDYQNGGWQDRLEKILDLE